MPIFEARMQIGDSNPGGPGGPGQWLDGQILRLAWPGFVISSAEYTAWLRDDAARPATFGLWSASEQALHEHRMKEIRYLTDRSTTALAAASVRYGTRNPDDDQVAEAVEEMRRARAALQRIASQGYDLRWGFDDVKDFAIVRVNLTERQVADALEPEKDYSAHPYRLPPEINRSGLRIPYESLISAGTRNAWIDPTRVVPVNRSATPLSGPGVLQPIAQRPPPPTRLSKTSRT